MHLQIHDQYRIPDYFIDLLTLFALELDLGKHGITESHRIAHVFEQ